MILSLVAAVDEQGGIGIENRLPWHLSRDLQRFKKLTMGHHLLMGRKTYQSIGEPLPGRTMIVLSRNPDYQPEGCLVRGSFQEGLQLAEERGEKELFIIGGSSLFEIALPRCDHLYLTRVHTAAESDVLFPPFDPGDWRLICEQHQPADLHNDFAHTFRHYLPRAR